MKRKSGTMFSIHLSGRTAMAILGASVLLLLLPAFTHETYPTAGNDATIIFGVT